MTKQQQPQQQNQGYIGSGWGAAEGRTAGRPLLSGKPESWRPSPGQHWCVQRRQWEASSRMNQRAPPSRDLPALVVFSASFKSSEYWVSLSQGLLWLRPRNSCMHLITSCIFKFLKGRRNYALLALIIFFSFLHWGAQGFHKFPNYLFQIISPYACSLAVHGQLNSFSLNLKIVSFHDLL